MEFVVYVTFVLHKTAVTEDSQFLFQAKCAELDEEVLQLQVTLSDAEHDRQKITEVLAKVKQQRNEHEQKYLALLSVIENLKSQASDQNTVLSKQKCELEALMTENDDIRREAENLRKENDDLKGEIEARKLEVLQNIQSMQPAHIRCSTPCDLAVN